LSKKLGKQIPQAYNGFKKNSNVKGIMDCSRDVKGGRSESQKVTAQTLQSNKFFTKIIYSADGDYVLACGKSKNICIYELRHRVLLKKIQITKSRSLDGVLNKLNSKEIKDGHVMTEIDMASDSDAEERKDRTLPGSKRPEFFKRNAKIQIE
jgi:periodic tryptophan protein 2